MTYIIFDGKGYEPRLTKSDDLLKWTTLGKLMSFTETGWDATQKAGFLSQNIPLFECPDKQLEQMFPGLENIIP